MAQIQTLPMDVVVRLHDCLVANPEVFPISGGCISNMHIDQRITDIEYMLSLLPFKVSLDFCEEEPKPSLRQFSNDIVEQIIEHDYQTWFEDSSVPLADSVLRYTLIDATRKLIPALNKHNLYIRVYFN